MYVVFKFRRVPVPGCIHPKNDHGLDKAASCVLRGHACAACSQGELRCWLLCSKLCLAVLDSPPCIIDFAYNLLAARVKECVLCPGM